MKNLDVICEYFVKGWLTGWLLVILGLLVFMGYSTLAHSQVVDNVDKVDAMAHAIARTEGFYIKNTIPQRLHNPGDITATKVSYPGQTGVYRGYAVFKSDRYGWAALRDQIQRIIDGDSKHFDQSMTFAQIAKVYAQDRRWGKTVCTILKITPATTFQEYFGLAPRVKFTFNRRAPFPSADTLNPTLADTADSATVASTDMFGVLTGGGSGALIFAGIL